MDVFEVIRTRRSIRKYKEKLIEEEKIAKVIEAARLAPSAANRQPWKFIIVTDSKTKEKLRSSYDRDWFVASPVIIVACALPEIAWSKQEEEEVWKIDVAIAMQNLVLAAWEEGLGTCWICAFNEKQAKKVLAIPRDVRVVAMTPLGYPAEQKDPVTNRKPLEEIIQYNHWKPAS